MYSKKKTCSGHATTFRLRLNQRQATLAGCGGRATVVDTAPVGSVASRHRRAAQQGRLRTDRRLSRAILANKIKPTKGSGLAQSRDSARKPCFQFIQDPILFCAFAPGRAGTLEQGGSTSHRGKPGAAAPQEKKLPRLGKRAHRIRHARRYQCNLRSV